MAKRKRKPKPLWRLIVEAIAASLLGIALFGLMGLHFAQEISAGRGLDPYFNGVGAKTNATIALVALAIIAPIVLIAAFAEIGRDLFRRWRK